MEKIVGILGGMGPEATVDLFAKVLKCDPALTDQDHLRIIVDCNSKIPDRNKARLEGTEDPEKALTSSARLLEEDGCGLIIIPCNAAHLWHEKVQAAVKIPVLHIMRASCRYAMKKIPGLKKVGLLGSSVMYTTGIYHKAYEARGIEVLSPDKAEQDEVMRLIREVKKGNLSEDVRKGSAAIAQGMADQGAQGIILGCTEFPLVVFEGDISVPVIDSTLALAQEAVDVARGKISPDSLG